LGGVRNTNIEIRQSQLINLVAETYFPSHILISQNKPTNLPTLR